MARDGTDIGEWLLVFRKAGYDSRRASGMNAESFSAIEKKYVEADLEFLESMQVRIVCEGDDAYPRQFESYLHDRCPRVLFCLGDTTLLQRSCVFICGARNASKKGQEIAYKCARLAADAGFVVISGYARGIDLAAHMGTLEAGGSSVAILPYGLSRFSIRRALAGIFDPENFLAVSEMPPTSGFMVKGALRRNVLLVALADAVIVVEPGESGGTWYSAEKASALEKPLFYHEGHRPEIKPRMEMLGGEHIPVKRGVPSLDAVFEKLGDPQ